jgi:RNA polymerase sigma-70 factor (ECF subfamily)
MPTRLKVVESTASDWISDGDLVSRAREGDAWAREALFRRNVAAVTSVVLRLAGRSIDAEDVVQDAFVTAFTELDRLRDPRAFRAWLLSIAVRKLHRRFRRRKLMRVLGLDRGEDDGALAVLADDGANAEVRAELALLDRALSRLPSEQRIAWMLRHVEGEALEDVARILECSLATAKRRIKAADESIESHTKGGER